MLYFNLDAEKARTHLQTALKEATKMVRKTKCQYELLDPMVTDITELSEIIKQLDEYAFLLKVIKLSAQKQPIPTVHIEKLRLEFANDGTIISFLDDFAPMKHVQLSKNQPQPNDLRKKLLLYNFRNAERNPVKSREKEEAKPLSENFAKLTI